jgi:hypothetical protein
LIEITIENMQRRMIVHCFAVKLSQRKINQPNSRTHPYIPGKGLTIKNSTHC